MTEDKIPKGEVWNCPKCNVQLVERGVKDYTDKRITRQFRWFKKMITGLKTELVNEGIHQRKAISVVRLQEIFNKSFRDILD